MRLHRLRAAGLLLQGARFAASSQRRLQQRGKAQVKRRLQERRSAPGSLFPARPSGPPVVEKQLRCDIALNLP